MPQIKTNLSQLTKHLHELLLDIEQKNNIPIIKKIDPKAIMIPPIIFRNVFVNDVTATVTSEEESKSIMPKKKKRKAQRTNSAKIRM